MTDRTDPVVEARPLAEEEEYPLRDLVTDNAEHGECIAASLALRLFATLDAARAAVPEPSLDVERLARAMDACLPADFNVHMPGNRVRAKAVAREYAALDEPSKPDPEA